MPGGLGNGALGDEAAAVRLPGSCLRSGFLLLPPADDGVFSPCLGRKARPQQH